MSVDAVTCADDDALTARNRRAIHRSRSLSQWTQHFRFYRRTNLAHYYLAHDVTPSRSRLVLAAFVVSVCILIALYLGLWCLDFSTLPHAVAWAYLSFDVFKLIYIINKLCVKQALLHIYVRFPINLRFYVMWKYHLNVL